MVKKIKWVGTLSTTERNNIGLIQVRQNNVNSEVLGFNIVDGNGEPYDLKNRKVLFCTYFDKLSPVEQYAEVIENGKIIYTMNEHDMQKPVRINFAYLKIMDENNNLVDTTQNFSYDIIPSIESSCMNAEPYIIRLEEVLDAFNSVRDEAMKEMQQIIIDFNEQIIKQQQDFSKWFESIREILESVDPGGIILNELVDFRYSKMLSTHFTKIKDRGDFWDNSLSQIGFNICWLDHVYNFETEATEAINEAVKIANELGVPIIIPAGEYDIDTEKSIVVDRDSSFILSNKTVLKAIPNNKDFYSIFHIKQGASFSLCGGTLIGDRDEHLGVTGESGHGIKLEGAKNVLIDSVNIKDFWGDGIAIHGVELKKGTHSENVSIKKCEISNCRRQGISVINVKNCNILDNVIHDINGTNPECGIDIEPNSNGLVTNINVHRNEIFNNNNSGIDVVLREEITGAFLDNVSIADNEVYGNHRRGIHINKVSRVNLDKNRVHSNSSSGITVGNSSKVNVTNNFVHLNKDLGIALTSCDDCVISSNVISKNGGIGINFIGTIKTLIDSNNIGNNGSIGINMIRQSNHNLISNNHLIANADNSIENAPELGSITIANLRIDASSNNFVTGNQIRYNSLTSEQNTTEYGIKLTGTVSNNVISNNDLFRSGFKKEVSYPANSQTIFGAGNRSSSGLWEMNFISE